MNSTCANHLQEANEGVIILQDDDPVHFEVMLRYIYTLRFEVPSKESWKADHHFQSQYLLPIGVFALADKYEVDELRRVAAAEFPVPIYGSVRLVNKQAESLVEAHYSYCVRGDCLMGQAIARNLLSGAKEWIRSPQFKDILKRYPSLGGDVLLVAPLQTGKLWS